MTHFVLIALGILIAVLTVVSALGLLPSLRIVPDDTHFDFTQFRRISFPISATLSIIAITLFFTHGLNFGIDFSGGTLIQVQNKAGPIDIAQMRTTVGGLGLGEVQLQEYGSPATVLIRVAQQPGGEQAPQLGDFEPPPRPRHDAGDETLLAASLVGLLARQDHRLPHSRMAGEDDLDLVELDAEAADLHLVVAAAQVLQLPVRPPPRQVPRAVKARAAR